MAMKDDPNYVLVPAYQVDQALDWAKQHCPSYITNTGHPDRQGRYHPGYYRFYFMADETGQQEMTAFRLRWT